MLSSLSSLLIQHFLMFIFLQINKDTGDGQFDSLISSCWILPCCPGCLEKKDYQPNSQQDYSFASTSHPERAPWIP